MEVWRLPFEERQKVWTQQAEDWHNNRQREIERQLASWPEHLRAIGKALFDLEDTLSDGYRFYASGNIEDLPWASLVDVAEQLYQAAHE